MRATKQKTAGAVSDLNRRIDRCIELKNEIAVREAELKAERDAIMGTMQSADLTRYASAAGNEALRVTSESVTWNVVALEAALNDDEMDELCPRKAESAKLRKRCESEQEFALRVKKCAKKTKKEKLEVRAKGEEAAQEEAA